jgi:hypothetical protein
MDGSVRKNSALDAGDSELVKFMASGDPESAGDLLLLFFKVNDFVLGYYSTAKVSIQTRCDHYEYSTIHMYTSLLSLEA